MPKKQLSAETAGIPKTRQMFSSVKANKKIGSRHNFGIYEYLYKIFEINAKNTRSAKWTDYQICLGVIKEFKKYPDVVERYNPETNPRARYELKRMRSLYNTNRLRPAEGPPRS